VIELLKPSLMPAMYMVHYVQNRVMESLEIFGTICSSRWFLKSTIILFLNKFDVLKEKLQQVEFKSYFNDYTG
jgi:guanine nucleotide-binding protein subunit alpha